jgi:hypothetical protein
MRTRKITINDVKHNINNTAKRHEENGEGKPQNQSR